MLSVNEWIELLERGHRFKIYVWCRPDVAKALNISFSRRIHSNAFCDYMKSTPEGIRNCVRCRVCADKLAQRRGIFGAFCIHGMFEVCCPVIFKNEWTATVYVSNLCPDVKETQKRMAGSCKKYSLSYKFAESLIEKTDNEIDLKSAEAIAEAAAEIIMARLENVGFKRRSVPEPVKKLIDAAADFYSCETLKSVSEKYYINEKYLGHLFKEITGFGFCDYKNKVRLNEAAYILRNGNRKIIDIAVSVGYDNVSYFSKKFRLEYGISPTEYRRIKNE